MANKKRLIDANEVIRSMQMVMDEENNPNSLGHRVFREIIKGIELTPTVDAVEVVHGHWKEYSHSALVRWKDGEPIWADRSVFRCSRCDFGTIARHNYCPRCGAKMDGGNEDA